LIHQAHPYSLLFVCVPFTLFSHLLAVCSHYLFFFTDTSPTEIYTLSLHDALPILDVVVSDHHALRADGRLPECEIVHPGSRPSRSEEHTSELQSRENLVCRLLLEKKKTQMLSNQRFESDTE